MPLSTTVLDEDRIAQLERELQESRENEQTSKAALRQFHQEPEASLLPDRATESEAGHRHKKAKLHPGVDGHHRPRQARHRSRWHTRAGNSPAPDAPLRAPYPTLAGSDAERIKSLWQSLPSWTQGVISSVDAGFLDTLVKEVRPDQVYEVGVASGGFFRPHSQQHGGLWRSLEDLAALVRYR